MAAKQHLQRPNAAIKSMLHIGQKARKRAPKTPTPITWRVSTSPGRVTVFIDGLKLVSELNAHEHWRNRWSRSKSQRAIIGTALLGVNLLHWVELPTRVTIWRIAPRKLDKGDNRESCGKWVRDQIAKELGVNDGGDGVDWKVDQRPGEPKQYAVEIVIESMGKAASA